MRSPFARSARFGAQPLAVESFLAGWRDSSRASTEIIPLDEVEQWSSGPDLDEIRHREGAFFAIIGIDITGPDRRWQQPIIDQPEVGILGTAVRITDDTMHCLMQAKAEPGTVGGLQLGPSVQATRSNYTRRHGGKAVPYLSHFLGDDAAVQGFDVSQSEQGARFLGKHNRNMVRFVGDDMVTEEGFEWFTVGELHHALRSGDYINFDARTVLAGLGALEASRTSAEGGHDDFSGLLARSLRAGAPARNELDEIIGWLREARRARFTVNRTALRDLDGWAYRDGRIEHEEGAFFSVVGARVTASGREVSQWCQPLIVEQSLALLGLAVTVIDDVLHVLLRAIREPGLATGAEIGPTVQAVPETYLRMPSLPRPECLDLIMPTGGGTVLYDNVLSGEGGRFYEARQRHLITLVDPVDEPPGHRWVAVHQFSELLGRGLLVNEQARSMFACLMSLLTPPSPDQG